jgi:hypothetical protein
MIKLRSHASVLLLALAPAAALADDYRFDIKGAFDRATPSDDFFGDFDTTRLAGSWYFAPVSTDGRPLAEAAFLGRASSVDVSLAHYTAFERDLSGQAASVSYYIPGTMLYAAAGARHLEFPTILNSAGASGLDDDTNWFGTIGIAPLDGLLVTTSLGEGGYQPNIAARYVGKLPNDHFYAGSVSILDPDGGDTAYKIDFDYYLDRTFSLGAGYRTFNLGADVYTLGRNQWEIRAEKFLSSSWAVGASAYTADGADGFGLHVTWRH